MDVNLEEATTGAAAVIIVARKCYPQHSIQAERLATADFKELLRNMSYQEQQDALDAARRKLAAMTISGQSYRCPDVEHLKVMARTWGFGHLILDTATPR